MTCFGDADEAEGGDEVRRLGPGISRSRALRRTGGSGGGFNFRVEDLSDVFGGLFGGGRQRRRGTTGFGPQRGADAEADLHLSFDEAVEGVVTTVHVATTTPCATCGGSGSRPGTVAGRVPETAVAIGHLNDNQGLFSRSRLRAWSAEVAARTIVDPCPT